MNRFSVVAAGLVSIVAFPVMGAGIGGGSFSIPWSTIDGGGVIDSTGGSFRLSGTIGQPDASGEMTGGAFSLTGGFWAGVGTAQPCPADLNGDGIVNFVDVSAFVALFGAGDPRADFNGDGIINFVDVSAFVAAFGLGCP